MIFSGACTYNDDSDIYYGRLNILFYFWFNAGVFSSASLGSHFAKMDIMHSLSGSFRGLVNTLHLAKCHRPLRGQAFTENVVI
jgi:hypothetical protein